MSYEELLKQRIAKAVKKDYAYLAYRLPYKSKKEYLEIEGEGTIETEPYSFTKISEIVRKAYEEQYPVKEVQPIGFRGEIFVSEKKELSVYATGGIGLIEYTVKTTKKVRYEDDEKITGRQ